MFSVVPGFSSFVFDRIRLLNSESLFIPYIQFSLFIPRMTANLRILAILSQKHYDGER